jgi:hypothetical protein
MDSNSNENLPEAVVMPFKTPPGKPRITENLRAAPIPPPRKEIQPPPIRDPTPPPAFPAFDPPEPIKVTPKMGLADQMELAMKSATKKPANPNLPEVENFASFATTDEVSIDKSKKEHNAWDTFQDDSGGW